MSRQRQPTLAETMLRYSQKQEEVFTSVAMESDENLTEINPRSAQVLFEDEEMMILDDLTEPLSHDGQIQLSAAERAVHLHPTWINREDLKDADGLPIFELRNGGIFCRICSQYKDKLHPTQGKYITEKSMPTHPNSLKNHIKTQIHKRAMAMKHVDSAIVNPQLTEADQLGIHHHRTNQVHAVNYRSHHHHSCDNFKALTNLLNYVSNPTFVSPSPASDSRLFWSIASALDEQFYNTLITNIDKFTPLSVCLDTSTDITLTSVLCVNLRYLSNSNEIKSILVGLEEMSNGTKGTDLFNSFCRILKRADINLAQIASVATDGEPAMIGHQKGFLAYIRHSVPTIYHKTCHAHKFNLALKNTFESPQLPTLSLLISNSIKLIHSITKSIPNTKRFNAELLRRGLPSKSLSKPVQIRWNTNQTAVSETRAYLEVISAVLGSDVDPETHPLPAFFRATSNQLRLSLVDYVLQKTVSPLNALQSNSLTFLQGQDIIAHLLHDLEAISAFDLKNEWASIPREDNEEFESSEKLVLEEAVLLLTRLCSELRTRFV
ncbi:hypothetical protein BLNAU_17947 [Blattamonas nauphoetae]|uniref:DUF4371 domain-containing protein n=1 Tax=Blattamonas nauphoetae TaxID=2049346 RepID=A0ABQ9XA65_9EUKA|nr:hypothetical protein BLNAU_17947 [Blattamonas nauphoetae]